VYTLKQELDRYVLYHDLAAETRAWYRRIVSVYCSWAGSDPPAVEFNGESISRFLADKQAAKRSPYYVKSLRNGLRAVLGAIRGDGPIERVRGIRCPPLDPDGWTPAEVERLLSPGCDRLPDASRFKWQLCILLGHYLGLDRCDIERLEQTNFAPNGGIIFRRRKTGTSPCGGVPIELLAVIRERCPRKGPICRMGISPEWFRQVFAGISARAGLFGTFKKLRKSSGSMVEKDRPGTGHKHLGNTRAIFEKHYEVWRLTRAEPTMPPQIKMPWDHTPPPGSAEPAA
jgi:hypothetical protein